MISRVQGLPTGYVVTGSDLENVAGGFPDAEGMYSVMLWRNVNWIHQKLKIEDLVVEEVRGYVMDILIHTCWLAEWLGYATLRR